LKIVSLCEIPRSGKNWELIIFKYYNPPEYLITYFYFITNFVLLRTGRCVKNRKAFQQDEYAHSKPCSHSRAL